jgi:hypothetical protein
MEKSTRFLIYFGIILLVLIISAPASAEVLHPEMVSNKTISFADLGITGSQDIQIWVGDTLVETANTSAGFIYAPENDYTVIIKPTLINRWASNPGLLLVDFMNYLGAFTIPLFVFAGLGAVLIGLAKFGRRH